MNMVRWQPRTLRNSGLREPSIGAELDQLLDWAVGGLVGSSWTRPMVPALDVIEEENQYVIRADLPGLNKDDIEITYQDGILTLKGEKKEVHESKAGRVFLKERFAGKFGRNLQLPEKVDADRIEATFQEGVLELVLPFTPEAQPKRIQISK